MTIDTIYKLILKEVTFNLSECKAYKIRHVYLIRRVMGRPKIHNLDTLGEYEVLDQFGLPLNKKEKEKVLKAINDISRLGGLKEKKSYLEAKK